MDPRSVFDRYLADDLKMEALRRQVAARSAEVDKILFEREVIKKRIDTLERAITDHNAELAGIERRVNMLESSL